MNLHEFVEVFACMISADGHKWGGVLGHRNVALFPFSPCFWVVNLEKWDRHCIVTYKKCQQCRYCLRKIRSFNIDNTILSMFYKSCIQSVLTFSFICCFGNVSQKDMNKLQRVVNISSNITGLKQTSFTALYEMQVLRKTNKIINDSTHILYNEYVLLPSSRLFRTIISKTNRKRDSIMLMLVRLLNSKR